jgi:uncharacterized membrane protein YhaH (DUF805 family)
MIDRWMKLAKTMGVMAERTGFRRLISSEGRASREEFWTIGLLATVFEAVYVWMLHRYDHPLEDGFLRTLFIMGFLTAPIWPLLCVVGRRLHDANLSPLWGFVPVIAWRAAALVIHLCGGSRDLEAYVAGGMFLAFGIVMGILKGTPGDNAYGPPPANAT